MTDVMAASDIEDSSYLWSLVDAGEGQTIELASHASPGEIGKTVAAFLNGEGGRIIIGAPSVESRKPGTISKSGKAAELGTVLKQDLAEKLSPPASVGIIPVPLEDKDCLLIEVPVGAEPPYAYAGRIYVRTGSQTVRATSQEISHLIAHRYRQPVRWEHQPAPGVELSDLDAAEISRTAAIARTARLAAMDDADVLEQLNLAEHGLILNAAVALFGAYPARRFPQLRIHAVRFADTEGNEFLDNQVYEGNLFTLLSKAEAFLRSNIPIVSRLSRQNLRRVDSPAYPWLAVREGLLNAIVHRDYAAFDGNISIALRPDCLDIWNPGMLPAGLTVDDLKRGTVSRPRNPDMAHVFFLRGLVERIGIGARRMVAAFHQAGLPEPEWREQAGGLLLTLRLGKRTAPAADWHDLGPRLQAFLTATPPGQTIRSVDYRQSVAEDLSDRSARYHLAQMVAAGFLEVSGTGARTRYTRTNKPAH